MRRISILVLIMLCLSFFLGACHKETEQDRVKKVITTVQKAAEAKKIGEILDQLSKAYHDPQGNDYEAVKGLLFMYFYQHPKISVYIPSIEATVNNISAHAIFQAILTGRNAEGESTIIPQSASVYAFDVSLQKEKDEWRVVSAKWEQAGAHQRGQ
jgi:hypothetical protein